MKDVLGILGHLGYREIRPEDTGEWSPLSDVNGRYGTTDETHIISRKRKATARLVDRDTGQLVATARKSVASYLSPPEGTDVTVIREDRADSLVVVPLQRFLSLLKETADPLERLLNELDDRQDLPALLDELDSREDLSELLEDLGARTDLDVLLEELKADD